MEVTDIQITPVNWSEDRDGLLAYCTIEFDSVFVVHDVKLVRIQGRYVVSMPSRRISGRCPQCHESNHLRADFCNRCGLKFSSPLVPATDPGISLRPVKSEKDGERRFFIDTAHPISHRFRTYINSAVVEAYRDAVKSIEPLPCVSVGV